MYRKVHFRILAVFLFMFSTFACNLGDTHPVSQNPIASDVEGPKLRLAAWNIRLYAK